MKRLEPNLLLAISTGFALVLVVLSASLLAPQLTLRNALLAVICAGGFVLLNPLLARALKQPPRPPMIDPANPRSTAWATLFPMLVVASAALPILVPGPDYGLLVIIAAVWFGVTIESAVKARRG